MHKFKSNLAGCRLYVGNIDFNMTKQDIKDLFSIVGKVVDVYFPRDENRPHRGYVFVQMSTPEEALDAIKEFHQELDPYDRELVVRLADFKKQKQSK